MIKIEKNPNFTKFFNVFAFGKLIEQVQGKAKANALANRLATRHECTHFVSHTGECIPTEEL